MQERRDDRRDQLDTRWILRTDAGHDQAISAGSVGGRAAGGNVGPQGLCVGLLGDRATNISTQHKVLLVDRFQTPEDVHHYFKNHYGPTIEAFANIGDNAVLAAALDAQLIELAHKYLVDGVMGWEYMLLTAEKK